jgi:putative ABC transport system permease protein
VRDIANQGPRDLPVPQVFVPFTFRGPAGLGFAVRTSSDPMRVLGQVRQEIQAVDRQAALVQLATLEDLITRVFFARPRFSLLVLGIFASTGIVLVAFGVYGVLAYTVSQQSREIAIRMALGGEHGHVIRMVLRLGLQLVGAGLIIGVGASLVTNRLLVSQLWNTSPRDPLTFVTAVSVIVIIGVLACWIPARRAVRVEPMVALRHE